MKHATVALFLTLVPIARTIAQTPAAPEEAKPSAPEEAKPTAMSWWELVMRPELWPRQCKVSVAYRYEAETISLNDSYVIVGITAEDVEIVLPSGATGRVPFAHTDALAVANATFAQMSPEQRALELKTIIARADLWPDKVTLLKTVTTGTGEELCKYQQGSELSFGFFDGQWVTTRRPGSDSTLLLPLHNTDLVARIRAALGDKRRPAVHRVLQEVEGKVISLRTGKSARVNPKSPPDYVLLYFSAGWCGPCHKFSPSLVTFYEQNKKQAGKRFEIIWISRDRSEAAMGEYAKELKFPWLAIPWDKLKDVPIAQAHGIAGIPDLVMLDAKGAVIASSYVSEVYKGADSVLKVLAERMSTKR